MKADRTTNYSLGSEMVDRMLATISQRKDQDADWGLARGIRSRNPAGDQRKVIYHSGCNGTGFRRYSEFRPDRGEGLVIMTNSIGGIERWNAVVEQWYAEGE